MLNLCITCSHFELNSEHPDPEFGLCNRIPPQLSLITGKPKKPQSNFASVERLPHNPCGVAGKHHTDPTLSAYTTEVPNV